jgi:DNA sulfur modification protein DndC
MAFDIDFIEHEIIDQYVFDASPTRPWIIGFSGGKDSTLMLQLVWNALLRIKHGKINGISSDFVLAREIYIVCNDTLVENPHIVSFIEKTLQKIQESATAQGLPIIVHKTAPKLGDRFWYNLIGRGYPAPSSTFRWCTDRLKIDPTSHFILEKVNEQGEVIILLGTRSDESSTRAKSIKKHGITGQRLRKHMLPNAYVFAPIKDVTTNELWQYLMQVSPPWGGNHKQLVTLYKNANSGDCPLVIDKTTPSCGNSRFGCWVCTVVKRDKSMEGLIDNGESWMEPLLELRDYLVESRDGGEEYRSKFRRNGYEAREGNMGPYLPSTRAKILRKLLLAQKEIQETQGETFQLINSQELTAIQLQWYRDGIFEEKVSTILNEIYNQTLDMSKYEEKVLAEENLLREVCNGNPEDIEMLRRMLEVQKGKSLMQRKRGLVSELELVVEDFIKTNVE